MPKCLVVTIRCDVPEEEVTYLEAFQDNVYRHVRDVVAEHSVIPGRKLDAFEIETSIEAPKVRWYLVWGPSNSQRGTANMFQRTFSHEQLARTVGLSSSNPIVYQASGTGPRHRFLLPGETLTPQIGETISVLHLD